ncbi:MAG: DUF2520 domain-containing protein [Bacteroidales bacterium]|nr:DUF2520 domain-containing protein [Bacteroidales bacterium]
MIALVGSGNVAAWMAHRLRDSQEFRIGQVYSRNLDHARRLADRVGAEAIDDIGQLSPEASLYLFSVADDAYRELLPRIPFTMPVALHTAGSVSQRVFEGYAREYGVLYPLQTFSKDTVYEGLQVPVCLETDHLGASLDKVERLAAALSDRCCRLSEQQRAVAHLAAVFACNFSNAMFTIADDILKNNGMNLDLLRPLMQQTLDKLDSMSPREAQTGPAKRDDRRVMEKHLQALANPQHRRIYETVSNYIRSMAEETAGDETR